MSTGRIDTICVSEKKGERKRPVESACFQAGHGIRGDAHAGPWHRQVSLLAAEDIETVRRKGLPDIGAGDFAENVVLSGLNLNALGIGTRLRLSKSVEITITQIGKECHSPCRTYYLTGDCIMPRLGLFARVDVGGEVRTDDPAEVIVVVPREPSQSVGNHGESAAR